MSEPDAKPLDTEQHLKVLRDALAELAEMPLPAPARAKVANAQAAVAALDAANLHREGVDRSVFDALLIMAGPEVAPELVAQMSADLRAVSVALSTALTGPDWPEVRSQTHVLVALAGAAGARRLENAARTLNMAAHEEDGRIARALGQTVINGLAALTGFVENASLPTNQTLPQ
ncbi:MAG: hypothetical protein ACK4MS_07000 [Paracoccaceae bacterium]